MIDIISIRGRYAFLSQHLDERARRIFAATEAKTAGYGGIAGTVQNLGVWAIVDTHGQLLGEHKDLWGMSEIGLIWVDEAKAEINAAKGMRGGIRIIGAEICRATINVRIVLPHPGLLPIRHRCNCSPPLRV